MSDLYQSRLQQFNTAVSYKFLTKIQRGIEKESLRITTQATMAQTEHPRALGSALKHSSITTDYSEALLEFITPVLTSIEDSLNYLRDLHHFTLNNIENEYLWPASMPCYINGDKSIPIAQYGSSNIGKMKYIYRQGLAYRYGRSMQSISGIHYNFSMPDSFWPYCQQVWGVQGSIQTFKSDRYFALIRNVTRHSWLLSYLFGASPVLDSSFMEHKNHKLETLAENTLGLPFATSLRMSDLGYQSKAQAALQISNNNLESYIDGMQQALQQSYPDYEKIGVKVDGQYRQLNSNILQIENEYYSAVRPKRVPHNGEKSLTALQQRGVEYIEVRLLDTNPFIAVGIDTQQIHFLDAFLLYCLLSDSPEITKNELTEIQANQKKVILEGRKPLLELQQAGKSIVFKNMAEQLLTQINSTAKLLDNAHQHQASTIKTDYQAALQAQRDKVNNSQLTPSGQVMHAISDGQSFADVMFTQSKQHQKTLLESAPAKIMHDKIKKLTSSSLLAQTLLEESDVESFDEFLTEMQKL